MECILTVRSAVRSVLERPFASLEGPVQVESDTQHVVSLNADFHVLPEDISAGGNMFTWLACPPSLSLCSSFAGRPHNVVYAHRYRPQARDLSSL